MTKHSVKYKKFLVGVASTALVASAVAPAAQTASAATKVFPDVKGNTHEKAVMALVDQGIITGYPDGTFKPNKTLTRSDIVKMMGKWLEKIGYKVPADYKTKPRFKDQTSRTNDELLRYSALVADTKVFRGYENGTLGAGSDITRENMAIVLVRAYDEVYKTDLLSFVKKQSFKRDVTDLSKAKEEARPAIDVLDYFDITNPAVPKFNPKNTTTRGHFASFLYRMLTIDIPKEKVDKSDLIQLVGSVEKSKKEEFTSDSWMKLQKALEKAKEVIADDKATNEAVKNAHDDLKDKQENLKPSDSTGGNNNGGSENGFIVATDTSVANKEEILGLVGITTSTSNSAIIKADIRGENIGITSVGPGAGVVTVTDTAGNKATIEVTVAANGSITIGTITKYNPANPEFAATTKSVTNSEATLGLVGTTVASSNEGIMKAVIEGGNIKITSVSPGRGSVTVTDTSGNQAKIEVTVGAGGGITIGTITKYDPQNPSFTPKTEKVANNEITLGLVGTATAVSNPGSIKAEIKGGNIEVTSISPGTGIVSVTNSSGNKAKIEVTVAVNGDVTIGTITKYNPSNSDVVKDDLRDAVTVAGNYKEEYFTAATWSTFANALAAANTELGKSDSTQGSVDTSLAKLKNATDGLVYKPIPYAVGDNATASQINLTFNKAVDVDGPITVTGGTVANPSVNVSNNGKVLSITSPATAQSGGTVQFNLAVGGKRVAATAKWNGTNWELTTNPSNVFTTTAEDIGSAIELQLLNNDGNLIDGEVNLDQLLNNPNLIRLNLLPGSGLLAGDVLKLATRGFNLLNVELTQEDINRGFVDTGVNTDLLDTLTGGENLDLSLVVTRGVTDILNGTVGSLPLPTFLTKPVVTAVDEISTNVVSILKGERTFNVDIPVIGANKVEVGDQLKFKVRRPGIKLPILPELGSAETQTTPIIITPDDISNGYVKASFKSENLVTSLLSGVGNLLGSLTGGTSIYITPILLDDGNEIFGNEMEVKITQGLLRQLLGL